jgi:hypothetical protein
LNNLIFFCCERRKKNIKNHKLLSLVSVSNDGVTLKMTCLKIIIEKEL